MKKIYVIIVFFFGFCSGLTSEAVKKPEFEFKHLSISDGLSQNTVMSISTNLQLLSDILAARGTRLLENYYCNTFYSKKFIFVFSLVTIYDLF